MGRSFDPMKKRGMLAKFAGLFVGIVILAVIINYICATRLSENYVMEEKQTYIESILDLVAHTMEESGQETLDWAKYCEENGTEMDIDYAAVDEADHMASQQTIDDTKAETIPEKQRMEQQTEKWIGFFNYALDNYNLKYMYFVRITPQNEVVYVADGKPKNAERDGKFYRFTGMVDTYDKPIAQEMPVIWKLWNSGNKADIQCELSETEYGRTYRLWCPVVINGEVAGLLGANIDVSRVDSEIRQTTFPIALWSCLFFSVLLVIILLFLKRTIVEKIIVLDNDVIRYSETKDTGIAKKIKETKYSHDEIGNLADNFSEMIVSLHNYMTELNVITTEKQRIGAELDVARNIQASMLPCIFPAFPDRKEFDIYASMEPAKEVGGDFYDFFFVDEDHLAMVMADVSGKGVAAALFMVIAKTLLKNRTQMGERPADILEKVNNQLCENNEAEMFVTVWLGILELSTGKMTCANAGHEYPVVKRAGKDYEFIKDPHGLVLAAMEGMKYKEYSLVLEPGDRLYLYTDGVPEAMNAANQFFGLDHMLEVLNQNKECMPEELLAAVKAEINRFYDGAPQFDDITMLVFQMNK